MSLIQPSTRDADHFSWLSQKVPGITFSGKTFLDIGCGSGLLSAELGARGAKRAVGVDIEVPAASQAASGWEFFQIDLNDADWHLRISAGEGAFDFVTCFDILEHVDSPVSFLRSLRLFLRPGGKVVLTTPNVSSWERILRGDKWSGAADPQHKILFNRYSLEFLLKRIGFDIEYTGAPIRKLDAMGIPHPKIGAQLFIVASTQTSR
jgi:2-polyprenyl-3-methyl-5-hydroxy-6-metoxy-1,4-benzoquinol methylase